MDVNHPQAGILSNELPLIRVAIWGGSCTGLAHCIPFFD
jgi:hypothetical protein